MRWIFQAEINVFFSPSSTLITVLFFLFGGILLFLLIQLFLSFAAHFSLSIHESLSVSSWYTCEGIMSKSQVAYTHTHTHTHIHTHRHRLFSAMAPWQQSKTLSPLDDNQTQARTLSQTMVLSIKWLISIWRYKEITLTPTDGWTFGIIQLCPRNKTPEQM